MSNHITASVEFYFKGEKLTSSIELALDPHMEATGELPELYPLLAQAINLGFYSYEYEMMQAEAIVYSNGKGLVAEHINEGCLDLETFRKIWLENSVIEKLQTIAQQHLPTEDLQQNSGLKNALLDAYRLGKEL
jgi:hypothetical protein